MAARKQLVDRCKELGAWLFDDGDTIRVDLPAGKTFDCGHWIDRSRHGWKLSELYDDILADLEPGVNDCTDEGCDSCSESMTPEQIAELYRCERVA